MPVPLHQAEHEGLRPPSAASGDKHQSPSPHAFRTGCESGVNIFQETLRHVRTYFHAGLPQGGTCREGYFFSRGRPPPLSPLPLSPTAVSCSRRTGGWVGRVWGMTPATQRYAFSPLELAGWPFLMLFSAKAHLRTHEDRGKRMLGPIACLQLHIFRSWEPAPPTAPASSRGPLRPVCPLYKELAAPASWPWKNPE